jgi:hypothetical protein
VTTATQPTSTGNANLISGMATRDPQMYLALGTRLTATTLQTDDTTGSFGISAGANSMGVTQNYTAVAGEQDGVATSVAKRESQSNAGYQVLSSTGSIVRTAAPNLWTGGLVRLNHSVVTASAEYAIAMAYGSDLYPGLPATPAVGKQYVTITSTTYLGASVLQAFPGAAVGDVIVCDLTVAPDSFALTMNGDGTFSYNSGGSSARESFTCDIYDVSAVALIGSFTVWVNNTAPTLLSNVADQTIVLTNPIAVIDMNTYFSDANSDVMTYTLQSGSFPGGVTMTAGVISGTPNANGAFPLVIRATDITGDFTDTNTFIITVSSTSPSPPSGDQPLYTEFLADATPVPATAKFWNGFAVNGTTGALYVAAWPGNGIVAYQYGIAFRPDGAMCIISSGTPAVALAGVGLSARGEVVSTTSAATLALGMWPLTDAGRVPMTSIS